MVNVKKKTTSHSLTHHEIQKIVKHLNGVLLHMKWFGLRRMWEQSIGAKWNSMWNHRRPHWQFHVQQRFIASVFDKKKNGFVFVSKEFLGLFWPKIHNEACNLNYTIWSSFQYSHWASIYEISERFDGCFELPTFLRVSKASLLTGQSKDIKRLKYSENRHQ